MVAVAGPPFRPHPGRTSEALRKDRTGADTVANLLNDRLQVSENDTLFDKPGRSEPGFVPLAGGAAWSEPDLRWLRSQATGLAGPPQANRLNIRRSA